MSQRRIDQFGTFHVTTNAKRKIPWCVLPGVPQVLIDNLLMTGNVSDSTILAYCILPEHLHIVVSPGPRGISRFMQSFKSQSIRDVQIFLSSTVSAAESRGFPLQDIRWQKSFHDERITDESQLEKAMIYVQENALKHDLVERPEDWSWTSLHQDVISFSPQRS